MRSMLISATLAALAAGNAAANEFEPALLAYYEADLTPLSTDPVLVAAVRAQNEKTSAHSQARIDELDLVWRAEVGKADSDIIRAVLENAASDSLRALMENSGGAITEIFVMDARGLNVASSGLTSDYWQGDEEKFTETFPKGPEAIHISDVEFDESSQTYQSQISFAIIDPDTRQPLGAVTVGVNATALD